MRSPCGAAVFAPVTALLCVAGVQLTLVSTSGLTPWKGGGFGMFSTVDDAARRHVRIFVEAPDRSEEMAVPPSLERLASDAALLPTRSNLDRLIDGVAARELRNDRQVTHVRVEVYRYDVDPVTLAFTPARLRERATDLPR